METPAEPIVLGIESTAHTFGVGVATPRRILASVDYAYQPKVGGIHPREAAEHHSRVAGRALAESLSEANLSVRDVDAIAVALGPGMGPCLRVGATLARYLALRYSKPLVPVNHAVAHIEIARFTTGFSDPLVIYIAGGNTVITTFVEGRYRIFGETLDVPLGNCFDAFAREVGLGFPGTPRIEELAMKGQKLLELPYVVKGQDLQFSGLLTKAVRLVREGERLEDVCYSLVETAYSMLVEVAERALALTGKREATLTGGVARSRLLAAKMERMAAAHGAVFKPVKPEYAGDNSAMIAYTGALAYSAGVTIEVEGSRIRPLWRLEQVDIVWRK